MAKLSTKQRKALPSKDFAGPDRSYPVENRSHARNALARVSQAENAGRMSKSAASKVKSKAERVLNKGRS